MPRLLKIVALLFCGLMCVQYASAQEADTSRAARPDTLRLPPALSDSLAVSDSVQKVVVVQRNPITFLDAFAGVAIGDTLPARHPAMDAVGMLAEIAGSFVYDFAIAGWPDGWSPYALSPNNTGLSFNGIPFEDAVTGRPAYELLPLSLLQPLRLQADRFGLPMTVNSQLLPFDAHRPITQVRYGTTSNGLQSVMVVHNQLRNIPLKQQVGTFGFTLAYGGHGGNGEYPGSQLEGARQLLARIRYGHPLGSVELINLNNRRRLGAHSGVEPVGNIFETVYNRFNPQVLNPNAIRQVLRNDLGLTVRSKVLPGVAEPFTASGYWTASTSRYINGDTLQARTGRLGYLLQQPVAFASQQILLSVEGWREQLRKNSPSLPDSIGIVRRALHASLLMQLDVNGLKLDVQPGLHRNEKESFAGGRLRLAKTLGPLGFYGEVFHAGDARSWVETYGWGQTVQPLAEAPGSRVSIIQSGLKLKLHSFDIGFSGFIQRSTDHVDFFTGASTDTLRVLTFEGDVQWQGATLDLGFRRDAERGFYLTAAPSVYLMADGNTSAERRALSGSMPELFVQGRMGLRYLLFQGDLDMDLYGQGRLWSSFRSRTLHPQTGLLALRRDDVRDVDGSAALDVVLEAGVRTAKIFVAFENLLSGTTLVIGNMLVPTYPLPQRRFRFGVYWPIQD